MTVSCTNPCLKILEMLSLVSRSWCSYLACLSGSKALLSRVQIGIRAGGQVGTKEIVLSPNLPWMLL